MKKISMLLLILMCILPASVYAYWDVDEATDYGSAIARMESIGVLNGYEDGTFRPNDQITREEFAKVVVCAIDREESAMSCGYSSTFYDVSQGKWSVPYINYVAANKIVTGYADGSFKPESNITYAEAATIILRIMGYNETDLGYFWPNNYVDKANSMLLANSAVWDYNAVISRATAAVMIDNALFGNVNSSAVGRESGLNLNYAKDKTVLEAIGYQLTEDVFIVATKNEDPNIASNKVRTSVGTYEAYDNTVFSQTGSFGTAVIDKDDKLLLFMPTESRSLTFVIDRITGNQVEYSLTNGDSGVVNLEKGFVIYDDFEKSTFDTVQSKLTQGSTLTLYSDTDDGWSLGMINGTANDIIPVVATHDYTDADTTIEGVEINKDKLIVYRDSKTASLSDIKINDVIYYNKGANIAEVFCKTVTGIYYEAKPSKAYVESVVVGNVEYTIGTTLAKSKLDASSSAFEIGARVTLLLGKDDEVVSVLSSEASSDEYGVLVNVSIDTEKNGEQKYIAKIFTKSQQNVEIIADDYYDDLKGELVKINYINGIAKLTKISNNKNVYGEVDKNLRKIGNYNIADDTLIIEEVSNKAGEDVVLNIIDFDFLEETMLEEKNVKALVLNGKFSDVNILYVKKWTDATKMYGMVISTNTDDTSGTRSAKIYTNNDYITYSTNITIVSGDVVEYVVTDNYIESYAKLKLIKSSNSVQAAEQGRIKIGGNVYETSRNVMIIGCNSDLTSCRRLSAEQLETMKLSNVKLYANTTSSDALIKVIIVTE